MFTQRRRRRIARPRRAALDLDVPVAHGAGERQVRRAAHGRDARQRAEPLLERAIESDHARRVAVAALGQRQVERQYVVGAEPDLDLPQMPEALGAAARRRPPARRRARPRPPRARGEPGRALASRRDRRLRGAPTVLLAPVACSAGASPKTSPVASASSSVAAATTRSTAISPCRGSDAGLARAAPARRPTRAAAPARRRPAPAARLPPGAGAPAARARRRARSAPPARAGATRRAPAAGWRRWRRRRPGAARPRRAASAARGGPSRRSCPSSARARA